jgi:beta-galactosidase
MKKLFNDNWEFRLDGASEWQSVEIPHDWLIYDTAKLYESGVGRYRKQYNVAENELNLTHSIIFDGVYMDSTVYVNGELAGEWKYGYTAFCVDVSDFLKAGANIIEVSVNHQAPNTRWYSGAGIYRNVYLNVQSGTRIVNDGVYISAKPAGAGWELKVQTEYAGTPDAVRHTLIGETEIVFESDSIILDEVRLWDIETPYVYRLKTELLVNNEVADSEENPVGFRTFGFSPDEGFILNNKRMKLHGVCLHHDLGVFGAAYNQNAARRQLEIMQDMGANAIRISHNPPAREYLDLCDELGLLVIDEAFDMWELPKNSNDYARFFPAWYERDVESWIRRDRNHPSVIMWCIGNEIHDTHRSERGREVAKALSDEVKKHDPDGNARVTIASNFMPFENAQKVADDIKIAGYNYGEGSYDAHHEAYPDWFIYGSENVAAVRSRGVYRFPAEMPVLSFEDRQCSDLGNSVVGWGITMERAWILDRDREWCGGQFIWTGMDYIGEPTPYSTKNSYFGAVDTAGLPKAAFYFYKAMWNKKGEPFIKLFPHWDWNDGQLIDVIAYSNAEEAELFLNDISLGRQTIDLAKGDRLHFSWRVVYEKGVLLIKAYGKSGEVVASDEKHSFGEAAELQITAKNYGDLRFLEINAVDKDGFPVENARNRIHINGDVVGLDSGDSTDYDSYKGNDKRLFSGKLVAIVRGEAEVNFSDDEIPLRKIELTADRLALDGDNRQAKVSVRLCPSDAGYKNIAWKCVLDTGAIAEIAEIIHSDDSGAVIEAKGDGRFKLRASCNNGKEHPEVINELDFTITDVGDAVKSAFAFVPAGRYDISYAPLKIIEHGSVAGVNKTKTLIGFKNVDFGKVKANRLRLFIGTTSYFDEVLVEVHIGDVTGGDSRALETLSFPRNNLHYSFEPHDFVLCEKLTGKRDICFIVDRRCVFGGFEFINESAFDLIPAAAHDEIYGDNYVIDGNKIGNIGNNVIINYNALGFGEKRTVKLVVRGFAPAGNSISMKLGGKDYQLEFPQSDDYITQEFDIGEAGGLSDMSLIFLPGSNFNFEWFKFI